MNYISESPTSGTIGRDNVKIDSDSKIAIFDGSSKLEDVVVDGNTTDLVINNIGMVVSGPSRVVYFQLIFISENPISVFSQLDETLAQVRFAG